MNKNTTILWVVLLLAGLILGGCASQQSAEVEQPTEVPPAIATAEGAGEMTDSTAADLAAIKTYAQEHAAQMKTATAALLKTAQEYYNIIQAADFDYEASWDTDSEQLADMLTQAKDQWFEASFHYELDEGVVAGVPSLAYYDTWIDAGPSGTEAPEEALEWELALPDGRVMENPGNFFHHLTEPLLWGTNAEFVVLQIDLDRDGEIEIGEVLPDANVLLGAAQGLDDATAEMIAAINAWEPTMEDAFTALVTMTPTMNEYFEQWKLSSYVTGEEFDQESFVAVSRLFDITGILNGLDVTYDSVGPVVANTDPELDRQINTGFEDLETFVNDLYEQEKEGVAFLPEEADALGTEAQNKAQSLAALVAQAANLLELELD